MSRDHYKGVPKDRDARIGADGRLKPLNKVDTGPSPTVFNVAHKNSEVVSFRTDNEIVHAYIDPVDGDDSNTGLSAVDALKTVTAMYIKFPLYMFGEGLLVVNFVNNTNAVVDVLTPSLHLGGGGKALFAPVQYRGPEMIPLPLTSGPNTASLDSTPAVKVDDSATSSAVGNRTRLDFTAATPGWTVNDLSGGFVRITRGGVKVFDELPISRNTADTIVVDTLGIVGVLLATDLVEVVRPAIKIKGPPSSFGLLTILKGTQGGYWPPESFGGDLSGATLERLSFDGFRVEGVHGLTLDRCSLNELVVSGCHFIGGSISFKNTISFWNIGLSGGSAGTIRGRNDDDPIDSTPVVGLIVLGGSLWVGSTDPSPEFLASPGTFGTTLPVFSYGKGIIVSGAGSQFSVTGPIGGTVTGAGNVGITCSNGAITYVAGGDLTTISGPGGDLKVGTGTAISYGTAVGGFEEVIGWDGNFTRRLEGTATHPTGDGSVITTATLI